jgi:phosphatidylserine decarboxylase
LFKESIPTLAIVGALILVSLLLFQMSTFKLFLVFGAIFFILLLFVFYFFRDPQRHVPDDANLVVSPADGKIVEIGETKDVDFFGKAVRKVAIFMSVWDVHINRIPMDGKIVLLKYQKGSFKRAYLADASERNEQMWIGIENKNGKTLVKQIAGILARRIVCRLREGDAVVRGGRFGMIKFGSRVELFLPLDVHLRVSIGDKVKGGQSIIGELKHEQ